MIQITQEALDRLVTELNDIHEAMKEVASGEIGSRRPAHHVRHAARRIKAIADDLKRALDISTVDPGAPSR